MRPSNKKIPYRQKIILSFFLSFAAIAALLYFVIFPAASSIQTLKLKIEGRQSDLEKNYAKGQGLKKISENLKIAEPEMADLEKNFIAKNEALSFITSLEKLADESGVSQKINLSSSANGSAKLYEKIPLQITAEGTFLDQLRFLKNLEKMNYYINIKSLEIFGGFTRRIKDQNGQEQPQEAVNLQILAETYWKK